MFNKHTNKNAQKITQSGERTIFVAKRLLNAPYWQIQHKDKIQMTHKEIQMNGNYMWHEKRCTANLFPAKSTTFANFHQKSLFLFLAGKKTGKRTTKLFI